MATKQVTIKDTSSNTLHPVTDSDVVYVGNNSLTSELSDAVHFDTISPATAVAPITTSMIDDGAITNAKIANNTITASRIAANAVGTSELMADAVTAAKIDGTSVRKMEVLYHYVQASNSSVTTNYDVPVDFTTYKYLELSVVFSTSGSSGTDWTYIQPLTSSKGTVQCRQCGIEAQNTTTITGINRVHTQLIAARYSSGNPSGYEVRFHVGADANSCIAFARGFGGDEGWQVLNVKVGIDVGIGAVKYLRVPLVTPRAGAHITLWGVKGADMGY